MWAAHSLEPSPKIVWILGRAEAVRTTNSLQTSSVCAAPSFLHSSEHEIWSLHNVGKNTMKPRNATSMKHWGAEKAEAGSTVFHHSNTKTFKYNSRYCHSQISSTPSKHFPGLSPPLHLQPHLQSQTLFKSCRLVLSWSLLSLPGPFVPLLHRSKSPSLRKHNSQSSLNYLGIFPYMVAYGATHLYA